MEEMKLFVKGTDQADDEDFHLKNRYGKVWFHARNFYIRKGLRWYYYPLSEVVQIEQMRGSRQLRQCCGAPIYNEKILLLTTVNDDHIYLTVEETENGDMKYAEKLLQKVKTAYPQMIIMSQK